MTKITAEEAKELSLSFDDLENVTGGVSPFVNSEGERWKCDYCLCLYDNEA